ncbi:MAG: hypothetical protein HKL82_05370 [Acidimicrobiaceae bacterium]|nr:hypothetical protein [Acidimicrobiaceae bacterium]
MIPITCVTVNGRSVPTKYLGDLMGIGIVCSGGGTVLSVRILHGDETIKPICRGRSGMWSLVSRDIETCTVADTLTARWRTVVLHGVCHEGAVSVT